ncbi:MAG: putative phospholipase c precursor protein, partial [Alphaproteobacteria bacterium]|nr:putative phospholipase c precursor protein [Alphaproteobacteria bacterium]
TGTIMDVEHVVILMQENRAFDHYFGMLRGVRGFSDPRALTLPSGDPVWRQPQTGGPPAMPFHLDTHASAAQSLPSLDHSWKGSHQRWKNHDAWIDAKTPLTMGYFTRADLPFYYALADAFTICDAYHCSLFGPTNPNRMFLFTGTNGLAVGNDGPQAIENPADETNETADPGNDASAFRPYRWISYAERLQAAGIDWRVYQEFDNYGDNALAYFANFRGIDPASELYRRGRAWAPTSNAANAKQSRGEHLVAQFAADVAGGRLPQVSWIVAPTVLCEHPAACPANGEQFTARLLSVLADHPEVWAKTAFILNYDENDGFFDHVPPPLPPTGTAPGKSSVDMTGERYHGEPVGLGPRVPMLVVSPWSKGGFVNSELFDHTSVIRFLERRFGVMEPNITPWRRAVCGDLSSAFDFAAPDGKRVLLPDTAGYIAAADAAHLLPPVVRPHDAALPTQEAGQRPARPLPYALDVTGMAQGDGFALTIVNHGGAAACLSVHAKGGAAGPWFYTVGAGESLSDRLPAGLDFVVHGPGGFLRSFSGPVAAIRIATRYEPASSSLVLRLENTGTAPREITIAPRDYSAEPARHYALAPGAVQEDRWAIAGSDHWYDLEARNGDGIWRFAGHCETGRASRSDPAIGRV